MGLVFFGDALRFIDQESKIYRKDDIVNFLSDKGIGIFDTACAVRRLADNASDKFLEVVESTDIEALLQNMPHCRTIVTTGQKSTETICERYGIDIPKLGSYSTFLLAGKTFRLYRMPSTSRAYPLALSKKADAYGKMFAEVL